MYQQDYEGADVEQQYLPDLLARQGSTYSRPSDQGYERTIGERMAGRKSARDTAAADGGARPGPQPAGKGDAMRTAGNVMCQREEKKRSLVDRQKREVSGRD